jgi:hypothetical protein
VDIEVIEVGCHFEHYSVKSSEKTLESLLDLVDFVVFLLYFAFLPYLEGPCNKTDFRFELPDLDYIYPNSYFGPPICFVYL